MKYNSLKNMTPEEKKIYKRKQRAKNQRKYYERHKADILKRNKGRYNYSRIYKNALERLSNYVKTTDKLDRNTILQILEDVNIDKQVLSKRNYPFLRKKIDMDRVTIQLLDTISNLSFEEICKMFREICYDQVAYYSDEHKGLIYQVDRSPLNKEQACRLQRKVSTAVDLYSQSVVDGREFEESYLESRLGL